MEEPGEAGSFDGNGRLFPMLEGPMESREVHECCMTELELAEVDRSTKLRKLGFLDSNLL